jgi:uncharacterized protein YjbJ (UPF0337 family)
MNTDIIQGKWEQVKGAICKKWGKITKDDVAQMRGTTDELVGKLQESYGYEKDRAKQEVDKFIESREWDH